MVDMEPYVEPHLTWRLLEPSDLGELEAFGGQLDALDNSVLSAMGKEIPTSTDTMVPELTIGGWDAYRSLSAYGAAYRDPAPGRGLRLFLLGGVHPVYRHLGIGGKILQWQVSQAATWRDANHPGEPLWLGCYFELGRPGLDRIAGRLGFAPERYYYDLVRDLDTLPRERPTPAGVRIEPFSPQHSEEVRVLHNEAFSSIGGGEVAASDWAARIADDDFRAEWSFLAFDEHDALIGYEMSSADVNEETGAPAGWTERFGVRPQDRGRGVALKLLSEALRAMRADGCREAGIGIDTPDGLALSRLVADLGYTTRDAVQLLSRSLP